MKKLLLAITGVCLIILLFIMCMPETDKDTLINKQSEDSADVINRVLRFGHNLPEDSAMHQASLRFADIIDKKSKGRIKVEVYPAQQLGNDHYMVEMARAGELDILLTPTAKMSVPVPAMQYADLPFIFPDREDAYEMLDGEPGQILLKKLRDIDLIGISFWENGFKHFTANRPIRQPEDFAGLKIRTMKSRIIMEQFRAFGATPIPIDFHATRTALADGVVDGQENPLIAIVSMGFHEVQSDFTLSNHAYLPYIFSLSKKVYDALPAEIQTLLTETALEVTSWEREETQHREEKLLETVRQAGVNIHILDKSARQRFADKTAQIIDQFEPVIGADVISKTSELLLKKYTIADQQPILIGLDTDLSMDAKISGLSIKRGVQLAIEEINAAGGVLGRKLALIARDHKGLPSKGLGNLKDFIADQNLVAVIGGQHGSVVSAEIKMAQEAGMPFLVPWAAVAGIIDNAYDKSFIFRVSANDRLAGPFIIKQALKKGKRPAILYENSVWGRGNFERMSQHLDRLGSQFVYQKVINRGDSDVTIALIEALKSGADVLIIVVKPIEGGMLLDSLAKQTSLIPVVSHWGITGGDFYQDHKTAIAKLDLSFFQTTSFLGQSNIQAQKLAKRYVERYGLESVRQIKAPVPIAQTYDAVHLLALAIAQAGSTERSAIRDALEQLPPFDGAVKHYASAFSKTQHDALGTEQYHMAKFASDGAIVSIKR
ncbi:MAG: DctP family TRAP transporter solute-binding subunit [gamma proteobacterium symbiont of Taylorina sp.]|nr:DctP family TRAP transporter solute-binding subunit [gamma proteobacterium symbiont of Taylorina sp.]